MEVVVPMAPTASDFHFDSTSNSPYASAMSSPKAFGNPFDYSYHYTSAPTSPTRAAAIYSHFATVVDDWEKPGTIRSGNEFDFAFGLGKQGERGGPPLELATADELFEEERIRPLKPSPRLVADKRPQSPKSRKFWSPRGQEGGSGKGKECNSLATKTKEVKRERGRERAPLPSSPSTTPSRSRRGSRSLSPLRGEGVFQKTPDSSRSPSTATSFVKSGGSRKWRLRDLLLFRSRSEGRATGRGSKDPLRKYTLLSSSSSSLLSPSSNKIRLGGDQETNSRSFGSTGSNGSIKRGSGPTVSAHEIHYITNRAASEELKKKTPLPYHRHNLFGCLHYNPVVRNITEGFNTNSFNRGRS